MKSLPRSIFSCVDFPYKLSNKFIEDFERIVEFIKRRHTPLQNLQGR